jgi:hypothetical protein
MCRCGVHDDRDDDLGEHPMTLLVLAAVATVWMLVAAAFVAACVMAARGDRALTGTAPASRRRTIRVAAHARGRTRSLA